MGFFNKIKEGLKKTRDAVIGQIDSMLKSFTKIDDELFEAVSYTHLDVYKRQGYINVIGAGLAGCEAAKQISSHGIKVHLYEMKPKKKTQMCIRDSSDAVSLTDVKFQTPCAIVVGNEGNGIKAG